MPRSYTIKTLIQLPRVTGREAIVLQTSLHTAATGALADFGLDALPGPLGRSLDRMVAAAAPLESLLAPQATDTQAKRKADRAVDNAWAAFHAWLQGWCLLPADATPHHAKLATLRALLFTDGLEFTQRPYKTEWQESHTRLSVIDGQGHAELVTALGGGVFLDHIRAAHKAYGDALHITTPAPAVDADIRSKLLTLLDAIRDYAARAAAVADPDEPGSEKLAEALLRPITTWESRPAGTPADDDADLPLDAADPTPTENPQ